MGMGFPLAAIGAINASLEPLISPGELLSALTEAAGAQKMGKNELVAALLKKGLA